MLHLIKADAFQLRHRKSFYFLLIANFALTFGIVWLITSLANTRLTQNVTGNQITFAYGQALNNIAPFFTLICSIVAFNNDLKERTIINTVSFGYTRGHIYLAKVMHLFLFAVLCLLMSYLGCVLSTLLFAPAPMRDYLNLIFKVFLPAMPIWLGYISLYCIPLFLSSSTGLLVGFFFLVTSIDDILALLALIIPNTQAKEIIHNITKVFFTTLSPHTAVELFGLDFNFMPILAAGYVLLFLFIGIRLFRRCEVK